MQTIMKRILPRDTIQSHWWSVVYQDRDGNVKVMGTINSEAGALAWADRINNHKHNFHCWAEPAEVPGVKS